MTSACALQLFRSSNERHAEIIGAVRFGAADDNRRLYVMDACWTGQLKVPGLAGHSWTPEFTATVYFRRLQDDGHQSILGNGFTTQSTFEIRVPANSVGGVDTIGTALNLEVGADRCAPDAACAVQLRTSFVTRVSVSVPVVCVCCWPHLLGAPRLGTQGGAGRKEFQAFTAQGQWHFGAISYNRVDQSVRLFYDGQEIECTCMLRRNRRYLATGAALTWRPLTPSPSPALSVPARARGTLPSRSSPLFVGAASANLLDAFCGQVHDVRVYNRALSVAELHKIWVEMDHRQQVCTAWRLFGCLLCWCLLRSPARYGRSSVTAPSSTAWCPSGPTGRLANSRSCRTTPLRRTHRSSRPAPDLLCRGGWVARLFSRSWHAVRCCAFSTLRACPASALHRRFRLGFGFGSMVAPVGVCSSSLERLCTLGFRWQRMASTSSHGLWTCALCRWASSPSP